MQNKLVIPAVTWNSLRKHLLQDTNEHFAFGLAGYATIDHSYTLLVRDLILVQDSDLMTGNSHYGLSIDLEILLDVMNKANREDLVIVEAHSHPFSHDTVGFSGLDLSGQREFVTYLRDVSPGKPYAAIVLGQQAVTGSLWLPTKKRPLPIHEIRIPAASVQIICASNRRLNNSHVESSNAQQRRPDSSYHRQVLAFGDKGQYQLGQITVGIVGLGGIGSIVALELAYLGVTRFVLADDDVVETTNLNRLVGAATKDVGEPKVMVSKRLIKSVKRNAKVTGLQVSVRSSKALRALKSADIIIGCVDSDAGRMILNELALGHMIPYLDCGAGINVHNGEIVEAGGRVVVWVPGRPCLLCAREFIPRIAAEELESREEREFRRKYGYVSGADVKEPAVISLNGTIASLAVTELLALVTGFRASRHYTIYDMLQQEVAHRTVYKDRECIACALEGLGDMSRIERYSNQGLPLDVPVLE